MLYCISVNFKLCTGNIEWGKEGLVYDLKSVVETGMTGMLFYT